MPKLVVFGTSLLTHFVSLVLINLLQVLFHFTHSHCWPLLSSITSSGLHFTLKTHSISHSSFTIDCWCAFMECFIVLFLILIDLFSLIFITWQHAYARTAAILFCHSVCLTSVCLVCPSVCPMPVLCQNEWKRHTFRQSVWGFILVFWALPP